MTMQDLLAKVKEANISIELDNGQLRLKAEKGTMPKDLIQAIKDNKAALVQYLTEQAQWCTPVKEHDGARYYELSLFQEELWLNTTLYQGDFYNQVRPFLFDGALNVLAFEKAIKAVIDRYEILRTTFHLIEDKTYQKVNDRTKLFDQLLETKDLSSEIEAETKAVDWIKSAGKEIYDLEKGPLIRFLLVKVEDNKHFFALLSHHIIMDGWSAQIIMEELVSRYLLYTASTPLDLPSLPFHYKDFAAKQNHELKNGQLNVHRDFWKNYLKGEIPTLNLPTDYTRKAVKSFHGDSVVLRWNEKLASEIQAYCKTKNSTPFIFFQALIKALLFRYTGQKDLIVGSVFAGRENMELEKQIGSFANILPVRTQLQASDSFEALLFNVKEDIFNIYVHQFYPFTQILKDLDLSFDKSHAPLFDVMLMFQNFQTAQETGSGFGSIEAKALEVEATVSTLDLYFVVNERKDGQIELDICFNPDLFKRERIESMHQHLKNMLKAILRDDQQALSKIELLSKEERIELLDTFNATSIGRPKHSTILELFLEMVERYPNHKALVWNEVELTYRELDQQTEQLALFLQKEKQITKGDFIGVMTGRTQHTIIAMLGIMKAGAVFMPINEELPERRIREMCDLVKVKYLLTNSRFVLQTASLHPLPILLIDQEEVTAYESAANSSFEIQSSDAAYIVFTSGSTGVPKPIVAKHEGLINNVSDYMPKLGVLPTDNYLQFYATGFDGFFFDIFPLFCGATLVMIDKETINNKEAFVQYLEDHNISMTGITPSYLNVLDRPAFPTLRALISAGEAIDPQTAMHYAKFKDFYNLYGPAEGTVIASFYKVKPQKTYTSVPIGKPCANKLLYVLDDQLQLLPKGVRGEIAISGAGIVDGYLNDPLLSAKKFVNNPFVPGAPLYLTGDLGQWNEQGELLFLGRKDNQVKINGYRVEIGEIEKLLLADKAVAKAKILIDDSGKKLELLAFYETDHETTKESTDVDGIYLRTAMSQKVPNYMVPARFIEVNQWPVTPQGKINQKALLQLAEDTARVADFVAPRNPIEEQIHTIWSKLLGLNRISIHDHFFEIGGDSLVAIRVNSAIRESFEQQLGVKDILYHPTIASLALFLTEEKQEVTLPAVVASERTERIPLSYAQERLWFIDQLEGSRQYHMPSVLQIKNELDVSALELAFAKIVERHEVLRTVIQSEDGKAYQSTISADQWKMQYCEGAEFEEANHLEKTIRNEINRPFNLAKDYMLRAQLIRCSTKEHVLILVLHHIAADGWSINLVIQELTELYQSIQNNRKPNLVDLPIQYADFSIWQRRHIAGDYLQNQLNWWKEQLDGIEPLVLPTDFPRPAIQGFEGAILHFRIEKELTKKIKALTAKSNATLFMTLLSALKVLLSRYSGQTDICIGSPMINRSQKEMEPLVGFFLNILALRTDFSEHPNFLDLVQKVKENTLAAYSNQEVLFEKIVDHVEAERDQSRSPLFQVMFVLQNTPELEELQLDDLEFNVLPIEKQTALFDLTFNIAETEEELNVAISYRSDLFSNSTIQQLAKHFETLLSAIVADPLIKVSDLSILTNDEQQQLLSDFNDTAVVYSNYNSIVEWFEQQVEKHPNSEALVFENQILTFQQLNERANQLGECLRKKHQIKRNDLVGIHLERSEWMLISMLGILKAGAAYVPIDTAYPEERIQYIVEDSQCKCVIDQSAIVAFQKEQEKYSTNNLQVKTKSKDLVYVIYTSGSTGQPKGVMIEHKSLINYLNYAQETYGATLDAFHFPLFTSLSFDLTQTSVWLPLVSGGTLFVQPKDDLTNTFERIVQNKKLNALKLTPAHSYFLELMEEQSTIEVAIVGGEKLEKNHVLAIQSLNHSIRIFNEYGPTEATIGCIVSEIKSAADPILIGRPIANTQIYITDDQQSLLPVGVMGEICIAGTGLARGYLNRETLTHEKFVPNPFKHQTKLYRTGDVARWNSDGQIEYLGRKDDQVKIRGYRIELGEVESVLLQSSMVNQCTVLVKTYENARKSLVAYVVVGTDYDKENLRTFLKNQLPEYMVPSLILEMEKIPLTTNGKVNKKMLPDPDESTLQDTVFVAPTNEIEKQLAEIWKGLLPRKEIGIHDNFFELGGDSILTIQVVSRSKRAGYQLQPRDLFQYQTIASLAQFLLEKENKTMRSEQGLLEGISGMLPIQQWFFEQEHPAMKHYNQSVLLEINKTISDVQTTEVIKALVAQHDALRFSYQKTTAGWTQEYTQTEGELTVLEIKDNTSTNWQKTLAETCDKLQQTLDFEKGKTHHFALLKTPKNEPKNRLLLIVHHLAIDGVSWRIILDDLENALNQIAAKQAIDLGLKGSSYRQWVRALEKYAQSIPVISQEAFWQKTIRSYRELPQDFSSSEATFGSLKDYSVKLDPQQTTLLLEQVNQTYTTEINDLLLSALAKTIREWSEQNEVLIGMEGHGREDLFSDIDISNVVGWFTNLYPVLLSVEDGIEEGDLIKSIKEQLRSIPEKGMGYGLLRYFHPSSEVRDQLSKVNYDIVFNNLGQVGNLLDTDQQLKVANESEGNSISNDYPLKNKLLINCFVAKGQLVTSWTYSTQQYHSETIKNLAEQYLSTLNGLIQHCLKNESKTSTPSDHGLNGDISYKELDELKSLISEQELDGDEILKF